MSTATAHKLREARAYRLARVARIRQQLRAAAVTSKEPSDE